MKIRLSDLKRIIREAIGAGSIVVDKIEWKTTSG